MKNPKNRFVLGAFIILIGVLALLDKFNIFAIGHLFQFWPTVFVVVGIVKLLNAKRRCHIFAGIGFVAIGVIMMLNNLGIIHVGWHDLWPVVLIGVGLSVMFKDHSAHKSKQYWASEINSSDNSIVDITAVMGGNKTINSSQDFKGGDITAVMGGVELDLRGASIQSEAVLSLSATWGGIVLKIPQDWVVINQGTAILGAIENKSIPAANSNKRLIISGTTIMGGVEIKN